jgi:hypothetical protein
MSKPVLQLGNLKGPDGNAFVILGRAQACAKQNKMDWPKINAEATFGDYENLLKVMDKYFTVRYF